MKKVKRLKLKQPIILALKAIATLVVIICAFCIYYNMQVNSLVALGYSENASREILLTFNKEYIINIGENKTLNAAFESDCYKEEYLDNYSKIIYQPHKNIISNINKLIKKGYSNRDISIILAHGNDDDVKAFAKRDKIKYLDEFFSISYAKLRYYDRYLNYSNETGEDEEITVLHVNLGMDGEEYVDTKVVDEFGPGMLVNKYFKLEESFEPDYLMDIPGEYTNNKQYKASKLAVDAFIEMYNAAKNDDMDIFINSAYRSYDDQVGIKNTYQNLYGSNYVKRYVALEGHSEHQTGLAFDIASSNSNVFANSDEYKWMIDNAYKYGFILRFSKKGESITGFRNEPWHFRFVGKKAAQYIHENNITFEEYYVMFLDK